MICNFMNHDSYIIGESPFPLCIESVDLGASQQDDCKKVEEEDKNNGKTYRPSIATLEVCRIEWKEF